jgi:membrane protease YdiL (CAAX protease family)
MILVDHFFILMLFVVEPIYGAHFYKKLVQRTIAGEPADRPRFYQHTMAMEWIAFAVVALAWYLLERPAADLGFVESSPMQIAVGLLVIAVCAAGLLYTVHMVKNISDERRAKEITALGDLAYFMPQNSNDYRYFTYVSITAGIVEEFVYRGFAFWYLAHFMPLWAVVIVSSIGFGLGHSYQGSAGVARVTVIGLAFGVFYVATGSIWLPMLAHAILDIIQGASLVELLRKPDDQKLEQSVGHS